MRLQTPRPVISLLSSWCDIKTIFWGGPNKDIFSRTAVDELHHHSKHNNDHKVIVKLS